MGMCYGNGHRPLGSLGPSPGAAQASAAADARVWTQGCGGHSARVSGSPAGPAAGFAGAACAGNCGSVRAQGPLSAGRSAGPAGLPLRGVSGGGGTRNELRQASGVTGEHA